MSNDTGPLARYRNLPSVVTEAQATTMKLCPLSMSRIDPHFCFGSSCMLWQWGMWPKDYGPGPDEPVGGCGLVGECGMPIAITAKATTATIVTNVRVEAESVAAVADATLAVLGKHQSEFNGMASKPVSPTTLRWSKQDWIDWVEECAAIYGFESGLHSD